MLLIVTPLYYREILKLHLHCFYAQVPAFLRLGGNIDFNNLQDTCEVQVPEPLPWRLITKTSSDAYWCPDPLPSLEEPLPESIPTLFLHKPLPDQAVGYPSHLGLQLFACFTGFVVLNMCFFNTFLKSKGFTWISWLRLLNRPTFLEFTITMFPWSGWLYLWLTFLSSDNLMLQFHKHIWSYFTSDTLTLQYHKSIWKYPKLLALQLPENLWKYPKHVAQIACYRFQSCYRNLLSGKLGFKGASSKRIACPTGTKLLLIIRHVMSSSSRHGLGQLDWKARLVLHASHLEED